MASRITVLLNVARTELLREGWGKSRIAAAIRPATWDTEREQWLPGDLPEGLWREPHTGAIMMAPSVFSAAFREGNLYDDFKFLKENFHTGADFEEVTESGLFSVTKLVTKKDNELTGFLGLVRDVTLMSLLAQMAYEMVWTLESKDPLAKNEAFAFTVAPFGIYTDRATDYVTVSFGQKYALHLQMNGVAKLYVQLNPEEDFIPVKQFTYAGGIDHGKPFRVTVIPWGSQYITFVFSQATYIGGHGFAASVRMGGTSFLYRIADVEDAFPRYEVGAIEGTRVYIKTEAGPLAVAMRKFTQNYSIDLCKVRFPETATLHCIAESLPETKPQADPDLTGRGYLGERKLVGDTPSIFTTDIINIDDTAWDKDEDTNLVAKVDFTSSSDRMYSPVLSALDFDIPADTHLPAWDEIDVSEYWQYARFQRTTDPDASVCELKIQRNDLANLFKVGGPVQIKIDNVAYFDGYTTRKQPVLEGPNVIQIDQLEARDMWARLNNAPIGDYKFVDNESILDTIKALIKRAGFTESDIDVDDPLSILADLKFGTFHDENDQKQFNQDAYVGDVIREIIKSYGPLPIRVRWVGDQWSIYVMEPYAYDTDDPDVADLPTAKFFLKSTLTTEKGEIDTHRWAAGHYYITSNPEFTILEPNFNGLICRGATSSDDGAQSIESVIPAFMVDPDSVGSPDAVNFIGMAKPKIVAPPEIASPQTQEEMNRITRAYWDRGRNNAPILEFEGEWQKEIDVDQVIWIIGVNDEGERVSYGAWRILSLNIEIERDFTNQAYSWAGSYTCSYVGVAEDETTPMFTELLPILVAA